MNFLKILFALLIPGVFSNIRDDFKARDQWGDSKGGDSPTKRDDVDDDKIDGGGDKNDPDQDNDEGDEKKNPKDSKKPAGKTADDIIKEAEERENASDEPFTADELWDEFEKDGKFQPGKVFDVDGKKMSMGELAAYAKGFDDEGDIDLSYKGRKLSMDILDEIAERMDDSGDEGNDEDTITLVKKTIPVKDFPELVNKAAKYYKIDLSKYTEEDQKKLLERYIDLKEGSKIVDQRHQDNATTKRELEAMQAQIDSDKQEVSRMQDDVKRKKEELAEKVKQANETLKLDPEDEIDDTKKAKLLTKQALADRDLEDAKKEEANITEREKEIQAYHVAIFVQENTTALQSTFPELKTKKSAEDIIDEYDRTGDYTGDDEDLTKALRIREALNRYAEFTPDARKKTPISKFYAKFKLSLPELKSAQPDNSNDKPKKDDKSKDSTKKTRKISVSELIARTMDKQKNTPRNPRGGSEKHSTERKTSKRDPNYAKNTGWKRDDNLRTVDSDYDLEKSIKDHKDFLARKNK